MSVGHIARAAEDVGIPTVAVMVEAFEHRAREARIARTLTTHFPMGRPLGAINDRERQRNVVESALALIETATEAPTIERFGKPWRNGVRA